jgi:hypothetical protein
MIDLSYFFNSLISSKVDSVSKKYHMTDIALDNIYINPCGGQVILWPFISVAVK